MIEKYALNDMAGMMLCVVVAIAATAGMFWAMFRVARAFEEATKYRVKWQRAEDEICRLKLALGDEQLRCDNLIKNKQFFRIEYDTQVDELVKKVKHQERMIQTLSKQVERNRAHAGQ